MSGNQRSPVSVPAWFKLLCTFTGPRKSLGEGQNVGGAAGAGWPIRLALVELMASSADEWARKAEQVMRDERDRVQRIRDLLTAARARQDQVEARIRECETPSVPPELARLDAQLEAE